jgi:hypothetical protein
MSSKLEIPSYRYKDSAVLCKFSGFHSGAMQEYGLLECDVTPLG